MFADGAMIGAYLHLSIPMLISRYGLLAGAAFVAGVLNAIAGGGSFISFPTLLTLHLPPVNANATNTVALWPGQITSLVAFTEELRGVKAIIIMVIVAAVLGGLSGALALLFTSQATFMHLVPWLLLFATLLLALSEPARSWLDRLRPSKALNSVGARCLSIPAFSGLVLVSFYIGYFGAGAAFLIYALFAVWGGIPNFHQVMALKMLCNAVANGVAVATFLVAHAVFWREGLIMLVLAAAGGYFGAAYSRKLSPRLLRVIVVTAGLTFSIYYFAKGW